MLDASDYESPQLADESQTDTGSSPSDENKPAENEPASQGDNAGNESTEPQDFHKHPDWQKREKVWQARMAEREEAIRKEFEERYGSLQQQVTALQPQPDPAKTTPIPQWFKGVYGDNLDAWRDYLTWDAQQRTALKQQTIAEYQQQEQARQQQETQESQKWNQWVESSLSDLQESGAKFDRNELIAVMLKYKPTDDEGNLDFQKGLEIYEIEKSSKTPSQKNEARRRIGAQASSGTGNAAGQKKFATPQDLKNLDWRHISDSV